MGVAEHEMKHSVVTEHILGSVFATFFGLLQQDHTLSLSALGPSSSDPGLLSVVTIKIKIRSKNVSQRKRCGVGVKRDDGGK